MTLAPTLKPFDDDGWLPDPDCPHACCAPVVWPPKDAVVTPEDMEWEPQ